MIIRPTATASRLICSSRNAVRSEQVLASFIARLAAGSRAFSVGTAQHGVWNGKQGFKSRRVVVGNGVQRRGMSEKKEVDLPDDLPVVAPLSDHIITKFEELPEDYEDLVGLPYTPVMPSQEVTTHIFGPDFDPVAAHRVFAVLYGRRVAGTLDDPSLPLPVPNLTIEGYTKALAYLRKHLPVPEEINAGKRAELELAKIEEEAIKRGESIGLYKTEPEPEEPETFIPQSGPKLPSGLERIRQQKKEEWDAKAAELEAKKQAEIEAYKNTPAGELAIFDERGVELRRPGQNPYLRQLIAELEQDAPQAPPEMSAFQRLWPSALVTLFIVGGTATFAMVYTPPKKSDRLFPDIPPAAATVLPIIALNAFITLLWHHAPAWKMLNRHFLLLPALPRGWAVLGNAFSHQSIWHMLMNMGVVFLVGTRLHDEVGRGNFLALYLSSAVLGSFSTLTINVLMKNFHISSLGASTATYGITAAYLWNNWETGFRIFGAPKEWPHIPAGALLAVLLGSDLWALRKGVPRKNVKDDHLGHLSGTIIGLAGMEIIKRRQRERRAMMRKERQWWKHQ